MYEIAQNVNYYKNISCLIAENSVANQSAPQSHNAPIGNSSGITKLPVGQEVEIVVNPRNRYHFTGLQVTIGEQYHFEAHGRWKDASRICGPEGWSAWWTFVVKPFSRLPSKKFFYLCGNVNRDERTNFPIGSCAEKTIEITDGQLYLFANDIWYFYGNNYELPPEQGGPMEVKICRII